MDSQALRDHFAGDYLPFYKEYFPALNTGEQAAQVACPFHEDDNPSMSLALSGDKTGTWFCHACNEGGDFLDFYAKINNLDCRQRFPEVVKGVADLVGLS